MKKFEIFNLIKEYKYVIVKKQRQVGFTTFVSDLASYEALNEKKNITYVCANFNSGITFLYNCKNNLENKIVDFNCNRIIIDNGSIIKINTCYNEIINGQDFVIIDEPSNYNVKKLLRDDSRNVLIGGDLSQRFFRELWDQENMFCKTEWSVNCLK